MKARFVAALERARCMYTCVSVYGQFVNKFLHMVVIELHSLALPDNLYETLLTLKAHTPVCKPRSLIRQSCEHVNNRIQINSMQQIKYD